MSCSHSVHMLKQLHFQRVETLFCDVTVCVSGGQVFPAHLCLLAAGSAKLHSLALSAVSQHKTECTITLDMLTARGFQPVLEYIYTGSLELSVGNLDEVFAAARYLGLSEVIESCSKVYTGISTLDVFSAENRSFKCDEDVNLERYVVRNSMEGMKDAKAIKLSLCRLTSVQKENSQCTSNDSSPALDSDSNCVERSEKVSTSVDDGKKIDAHDMKKQTLARHCAMRGEQRAEDPGAASYKHKLTTGSSDPSEVEFKRSLSPSSEQPQGSDRVALKQRSRRKNLRPKRCGGRNKDGEPESDGFTESKDDAASCSRDCREEPSSDSDQQISESEERKLPSDELVKLLSLGNVVGKLSCPVCGKRCARGSSLTRHLRMHSVTIYRCSFCDMTFSSASQYKRHAVTKHGSKRVFRCSFPGCKFVSDRLSNVDRHSAIHSEVRVHSCNRCGRTFAQDNGLTSHLRSCTETRSYLCDLCGAAFNHLQSMQSHRRIHTGEKPFQCAECGAYFTDYRNLKRHRRIHTNAFPYECVVCAQKFRHSNSLKSHHLRCHQIVLSSSLRHQTGDV